MPTAFSGSKFCNYLKSLHRPLKNSPFLPDFHLRIPNASLRIHPENLRLFPGSTVFMQPVGNFFHHLVFPIPGAGGTGFNTGGTADAQFNCCRHFIVNCDGCGGARPRRNRRKPCRRPYRSPGNKSSPAPRLHTETCLEFPRLPEPQAIPGP